MSEVEKAQKRLQEVTRKMLGDVLATENDDDDKTAATASIS